MTVLEEILAKGEVEPELLNELTDEQKIVLFYKIRQEQIKRWDLSYRDVSDEVSDQPKICFLKGTDGNEWVWVMGDAPEDESYDEIWVKYALRNAEIEAAKEISHNSPEKSDEGTISTKQQIDSASDDFGAMIPTKDAGADILLEVGKATVSLGDDSLAPTNVTETEQDSNSVVSGINISLPKYNGSNHEANEKAPSVVSASPEEMRALSEEDLFYSDEDAEETRFPVSEPVPRVPTEKKGSESSDDSMPFPVAGATVQHPEHLLPPPSSGYADDSGSTELANNAGTVISENVGTLQDRIRLFNQSLANDRSYNASPSLGRASPELSGGMNNLQIFKPVLPNSGGATVPSRYSGPRFVPMGGQQPMTANNLPATRMSAEVQPSFRPTNMGVSVGATTGSHFQPPTFKPTYSASVTKPYTLHNENFAGGTWQLQSSSSSAAAASPSQQPPHFNSSPQNVVFPFNPSGGTDIRPAPRTSRMAATVDSADGLSPVPRSASAVPQQIKTNPLAKPPSALPSSQAYKPSVPPRNFTRTPVSEFSSTEDQLPMTPINLDASVSQLIAKQNAMVRKFLRKSLINDEMEANTLQADWEERERKAKEKEEELKRSTERFREIARRVIQEQLPVPLSRAFLLAKSSDSDASGAGAGATPQMPQTKADVISWFQREELPSKASCDPETGAICVWFHGIIDRDYAERLLSQATVGSFLIRVSQKIYGYTLSYRTNSRCKHFLIDKDDNKAYQFFGLNMKRHNCLLDLVTYHRTKPVSAIGNELLINPIGQREGSPLDYAELFQRNNLFPPPGGASPGGIPTSPFPQQQPPHESTTPMAAPSGLFMPQAPSHNYQNRNLSLATQF